MLITIELHLETLIILNEVEKHIAVSVCYMQKKEMTINIYKIHIVQDVKK